MELKQIKSLKEFNEILNDTANDGGGNDSAVTVSSWGSRDFTLKTSENGDIHAKMSEIVETFARLAATDPDKHLIGAIHDRIFELNAAGEKKLTEIGGNAVLLRDIKTLFFRSHSSQNDKIELSHISTEQIKNNAEPIIKEFNQPNENKFTISSRLIKSMFSQEQEKGKNIEHTKNIIRYIVQHDPKSALEIIKHLKTTLKILLLHPVNPKAFIESVQHFLEVQEKEIYFNTKLQQTEESGSSQDMIEKLDLTLPIRISLSNPVANFKAQFGDNFRIILDEKTSEPTIQLQFKNDEDKSTINIDLDKALMHSDGLSLYPSPPVDSTVIGSTETHDKNIRTLSPHQTILLSGISKEHFLESMYQAKWEQDNVNNQNNEEKIAVLKGVFSNLTKSEVETFLRNNQIDMSKFPENSSLRSLFAALHPELANKINNK